MESCPLKVRYRVFDIRQFAEARVKLLLANTKVSKIHRFVWMYIVSQLDSPLRVCDGNLEFTPRGARGT
jgi:hypothetical protein